MEKLVQQLIEKHHLDKSEAMDAIRLVTDYLKTNNPSLRKLIDSMLEDCTDGQAEGGEGQS